MVKVSAGSYDLNKWLYGGYESDIISVIYGGAGTGKTNFVLLAAVSQAKKGKKVIFIDSEGGFSVERVKQLAGSDFEGVLQNILLLRITNFSEQRKIFDTLSRYLKDEAGLIVVDSMTTLYRNDFAEARDKNSEEVRRINSELAKQMRVLAGIAYKNGIAVIVTNQIYRWEDSDKMVGGDILNYWGKCLIELVNDKGKRSAYLRKHRHLGNKSFAFQIFDGGIRKKGWI